MIPGSVGWRVGPTRLLLSPGGADDGGQSCLALLGGCWDPVLHSPISFNQGNAQLCPGPGGVTGGLMAWHTQPRWQPGLRWPRSSALPNANCIAFLQEMQEGKGLSEHSYLHSQPQTFPGPATPWTGLHQPQICCSNGGMSSVLDLMGSGWIQWVFLGANNVSKGFCLGDSILHSRASYPPKCRGTQTPGLCDQGTSTSYSGGCS